MRIDFKKNITMFALVFFIMILPIVRSAGAATFCVSTSVELYNALQTAAKNGEDDIIRIVQGTYHGSFFYVSTEPNSLTIEGGYETGCTSRTIDPANTVLDGNSAGRVIVISTDKATHATIDGITVQNGAVSSTVGGGLYFKTSGGDLQVESCSISGNFCGMYGGGVYADGGTLTLTNNTFTGNSASSEGGGVYAYIGSLTFTNNTFTGNSGSVGGGVYAISGTLTFTNNTFTGNSASSSSYVGGGGGVYASAYNGTLTFTNNTFTDNSTYNYRGGGVYASAYNGTLTFTNNTFTDNSASSGGGAYADSGTLTLTNNTFTGNSGSSGSGGGVYASAISGTLTFTNNTFTDNSASSGGGVYADSGTLTLTNNTFYSNQARSEGGAIRAYLYDADSLTRIYNNILWTNTAPNGADVWINNDGNNDFLPSPVNLFNNEFDQSAAGTWIKIPFPIDPSNLDKVDPLFVDAANGDLHLSPGSTCIDAGNSGAPELPDTDKDGNPRICDGTVDMGAYEFAVFNVEPSGSCGGKTPCYSTIQQAINAVFVRGIIRLSQGIHPGAAVLRADKSLTVEGGWDTSFQTRTGGTILRQAPKAEKGSLTLQNLNIKPE